MAAQSRSYSKSVLPKHFEQAQPFTVLVEGNIASGKTIFLEHFQKKYKNVDVLTEPLDNGVNLMNLFYKEPHKWTYSFENYLDLTETMLQSHALSTDKTVKLMERSIFSTWYCFVKNMYQDRTISESMYKILKEWYKYIDKFIYIPVDLIIYLRTSPEVVFERITNTRTCSNDSCVPLKYLKKLHEYHENWLIKKNYKPEIPVLELSLDKCGLRAIKKEYEKAEKKIFTSSFVKPILN